MRPSKLSALVQAGALLVFCALAVMAVDCGGDPGCVTGKFALGYLLVGLLVAFTGPIVLALRVPVTRFIVAPFPVFSPIAAFAELSTRAPPTPL